jgi:predicted nucleotide-binding protein
MSKNIALDVLIEQGNAFSEELYEHLHSQTPVKSHWDEIETWERKSVKLISETDSVLLNHITIFNVGHHAKEIYPAMRSILSVLKALKQVNLNPDLSAESHIEKEALEMRAKIDEKTVKRVNNQVFVVHGHDEAMKLDIARFLERAGLDPIILHEQADEGRTIIEKFERHASNAGFAVVLMSPDDVGAPKSTVKKLRSRARQNVIVELGYFLGALGRSKICVLISGDIEIPSDYLGVVYKKYDPGGGWKLELSRELIRAGYPVDLRTVLIE